MDGKVPIEEYIRILRSKGFDGMLVSDHNSYKGYRAWRDQIKGRRYQDFVVLKGIEYDTIDAGHILVIMPEDVKLGILELRGLPVHMLIEIVHKNGGILGPAHPCGEKYLSIFNTGRYRNRMSVMKKFDFLESFNACEDSDSNHMAAFIAEQFGKPAFGGSDAHKADCVGMAYTDFPRRILCESDLIACVKAEAGMTSVKADAEMTSVKAEAGMTSVKTEAGMTSVKTEAGVTPVKAEAGVTRVEAEAGTICLKEGKRITCGGELYKGTTKEKIGKANDILVQSFWFYNRLGSLLRRHKRRKVWKGYSCKN